MQCLWGYFWVKRFIFIMIDKTHTFLERHLAGSIDSKNQVSSQHCIISSNLTFCKTRCLTFSKEHQFFETPSQFSAQKAFRLPPDHFIHRNTGKTPKSNNNLAMDKLEEPLHWRHTLPLEKAHIAFHNSAHCFVGRCTLPFLKAHCVFGLRATRQYHESKDRHLSTRLVDRFQRH